MDIHSKVAADAVKFFNSDIKEGLNAKYLQINRREYGENVLTKKKKQSIGSKIMSALKEPMIIILIFSFLLALGTNLGKFFKIGEADFLECVGILLAIVLSVSITLIMEGSSERAFNALNKIYDNVRVKLIRDGQTITARQKDVVVGDVIIIESGDKIVADGRLLESTSLFVDESALTGESVACKKDARLVLYEAVPLAERKNMVYSGTFVTAGNGKMLVTAVGDNTEIGKIAGELNGKSASVSPLQLKLNKLGKTISIIGAISAAVVFIISIIKMFATNTLTFSGVQELFVSSIILIVAAVPEGLPTIVAVSLALNMIKLASENALIKKISATETAGAVNVICSDKTGTLTENKMKVVSVCQSGFCSSPEKGLSEALRQNFVCNSTADIIKINGKKTLRGSGTECALLNAYEKEMGKIGYKEYRDFFKVIDRKPFDSESKFMTTTIRDGDGYRKLVKGAPEVVLDKCSLTKEQKTKLAEQMETYQREAKRVLCFAHEDYDNEQTNKLIYDGFVAIADPIRKEVYKAVKDCKRAGIKIKILTGDNKITAFAVAKELGIAKDERQVVLASELEALDEQSFRRALSKITVVARSTPLIKLKIAKTLMSMGEVVAVTGDGINDAPAIKQADVGICMGISGSEISKEAADVVLLDDSFATVVKTISFGRNVYKNLQRFILFQLSVNLSALLFITVCAIMGLESPFNTFQLLWINVIMDGPPALTLGLEQVNSDLMKNKPIRKTDGLVGKKMLARILINGLLVGGTLLLQYTTNFLCVKPNEIKSTIFTMFILFQLFNAFNCRELGGESILKRIGKNKIMLYTFLAVFIIHVFIVEVCYKAFAIAPLSFSVWIKILLTCSLIVVVSEVYKLIYRVIKRKVKA